MPVKVWVQVTDLVTDSHFPLDGVEQIKRNLVAFIGGNTRGGLNIGQPVIQVTLPTEVLKVPGVVDFNLRISADGEHFGWENIEMRTAGKITTICVSLLRLKHSSANCSRSWPGA